ncbi:3'(2'),5'-bisphosphate nucleotidase CysQ [Sulfuricurvum sp.]|uniref:3'(2'),5'-bisphosphate nucleotidase CysQ n=1 Tax=Sulfuricurvum sp. TaxID=2025608 RepID=UPI0025D0C435|nr:3'(2'),5'-bisphosphate nucleotidase CysQ [Sulfuricurvum sp.]
MITQEVLNKIAQTAGDAILKIYNSCTDMEIVEKSDGSPVTKADYQADAIIQNLLRAKSSYPILSEENPVPYEIRKTWTRFWIVDPLDGTKDFIAKNGQFTVNIALIEDNYPIMGVVYVPVSATTYYAQKGFGAYKNDIHIYNRSTRKELIATDSIFHSTEETLTFLKDNNIANIIRFGSSIKLCKLAEGEIDVYPRFNGTKEWDTAAGHIIANEAGCKLIDIKTKVELLYNKKDIKNNYFIASRNNLEF